MKNTIKTIICTALGLILMGCGKTPPKDAIAKVGDIYITKEEFDAKAQNIVSEYNNYLKTKNGKSQFLDILIKEKLMIAAAQDSKIAKSKEFKKQYEQMEKTLRESMEKRLKDFREYLLTTMWVDKLRESDAIIPTEDEIAQYYKEHPYEVSISHILLDDPEEAELIYKRLKRNKSEFASIARTRSLDAETAGKGGKLPPLMVGEFLPSIENAALKMQNGEVQGFFKSPFGYHIIYKHGEQKIPFEKAKKRIAKILEKQKFDKQLETIEQKYKVEVLNDDYKQD
jgi:peptidyl-prolyl cis-trans isomerase C